MNLTQSASLSVRRLSHLSIVSVVVLLAWTLLSPVSAQSFQELEQRLFEHPSLVALQFNEKESREKAEASLGLPDPVLTVGVNNVPLRDPAFDRFLPTNKAIGVRQSLPNMAERRAKSTVNKSTASLQRMQGEWQFAALKARLISLLAKQTSLTEQLSLLVARDAKYDELEEVIQSEINAGRPVVFRIADIDIERADMAREKALIDATRISVRAEIVELVSVPAVTRAPVQELASWDGAAGTFYSVQIANRDVTISDAGISVAEAAFRPDWGLSLTYQQREDGSGLPGSTFDGDDWFSASVSVTVPLWSRQNQQPKLRAAKAAADASRQKSDVAARAALSSWRRLGAQIDASREYQQILEEKILLLDERIEALTNNYEAGLGDYSAILDAEIAQLKLRGDVIAERATETALIARANSLLVTS